MLGATFTELLRLIVCKQDEDAVLGKKHHC